MQHWIILKPYISIVIHNTKISHNYYRLQVWMNILLCYFVGTFVSRSTKSELRRRLRVNRTQTLERCTRDWGSGAGKLACTWMTEGDWLAVFAFRCLNNLAPAYLNDVHSMSPIFQVHNICVLRRHWVLPYHRNTTDTSPNSLRLRNDLYCVESGVKLYSLTHSEQSTTERFVLRRQKPGTVYR